MKIGTLFRKQLVPTVLGMVFSALFIITDGVFVGRGIGSDALAAVNIAAPLFVFAAGLGLMFGMGGAIVASINLSRNKEKVANINATQSVIVSSLIMLAVSLVVILFPVQTARMLGAPDDIIGLAAEYLVAYAVFAVFQTLLSVLTFFVRIDGPNVAMWCMTISTIINIVLDYLFIFVFKWGLTGAAVATGIGEVVGVALMIVFLLRYSPRIKLGKLKLSRKSLMLTARNSGYIIRLGFSAFLGEAAIAVMMLAGNYVFVRYLGTNGVAAFSIVCYFFPIIFMVFNAIIQSAQPIISFNYGCNAYDRSKYALKLAIWTTVGVALLFQFIFTAFREPIVSLFINDPGNEAWQIAVSGIPFFASGYLFFGINVIAVGYLMSVERTGIATFYTLLRGILLPLVCFFTLPLWLGVKGIWLAVAVAEGITTCFILSGFFVRKRQESANIYKVNT
ncbi:MATE family efflux transporter [Parabacteroides sp. OttesenSCG-928-G06]|nr:MATE family efflux transporter [Parabacteroides sp. OttesenSCG-928-K15]MDL2282520.1 MATE family efflux transporter [Parabacteroides sp. OttesenSCG-928-G06]